MWARPSPCSEARARTSATKASPWWSRIRVGLHAEEMSDNPSGHQPHVVAHPALDVGDPLVETWPLAVVRQGEQVRARAEPATMRHAAPRRMAAPLCGVAESSSPPRSHGKSAAAGSTRSSCDRPGRRRRRRKLRSGHTRVGISCAPDGRNARFVLITAASASSGRSSTHPEIETRKFSGVTFLSPLDGCLRRRLPEALDAG